MKRFVSGAAIAPTSCRIAAASPALWRTLIKTDERFFLLLSCFPVAAIFDPKDGPIICPPSGKLMINGRFFFCLKEKLDKIMEMVSTVTLTNSIQIQLQVLCRHFASLTAADYAIGCAKWWMCVIPAFSLNLKLDSQLEDSEMARQNSIHSAALS